MADIDFWQNDAKRRDEIQAIFEKTTKDYFERFPLIGLMNAMEPDGEMFMKALVELTELEKKYKYYMRTKRKFFVTYEDKSGFVIYWIASSDPQLYQKTKKDKTAINVKEYKSLSDFIVL